MRFEDAFKEYLILGTKHLKKQSFDCFLYNFNANILSFFKDIYLESLTLNDIEDWKKFIVSKNFCNNHNKNLYSMLKKFLSFCHYKYAFDDSIFLEVCPFREKVEKRKTDFYTLKEFNRFIKYVDDNIYKQFFNLMFFTGTRPGETMALRFSDLSDNYITINKTIDEHGKRLIDTPKTMSSNREIKIDNHLKRDLLKLEL